MSVLRVSQWESDVLFKFRDTLVMRAEAASRRQQRDLILDVARAASLHYPLQPSKDVFFEVGRLMINTGRFTPASIMFEESRWWCGEHHVAWYNMGLCHHRAGHYAQAVACHRRSLAINPDYLLAREWLREARARLDARRTRSSPDGDESSSDAASAVLEAATEVGPGHWTTVSVICIDASDATEEKRAVFVDTPVRCAAWVEHTWPAHHPLSAAMSWVIGRPTEVVHVRSSSASTVRQVLTDALLAADECATSPEDVAADAEAEVRARSLRSPELEHSADDLAAQAKKNALADALRATQREEGQLGRGFGDGPGTTARTCVTKALASSDCDVWVLHPDKDGYVPRLIALAEDMSGAMEPADRVRRNVALDETLIPDVIARLATATTPTNTSGQAALGVQIVVWKLRA